MRAGLQAVIRAVCAIIDAFHFPLPDDDVAGNNPVTALVPGLPARSALLETAAGAASMADHGASAAVAAGGGEAELAREIQAALVRRVLPALQAQLVRLGLNPMHPNPRA